jgi:DNA gyrase subunit A
MLISDKGTLVRTRVDEVSVQGRNTQGVRLIKLKEGELLVSVERVQDIDNEVTTEEDGDVDA